MNDIILLVAMIDIGLATMALLRAIVLFERSVLRAQLGRALTGSGNRSEQRREIDGHSG